MRPPKETRVSGGEGAGSPERSTLLLGFDTAWPTENINKAEMIKWGRGEEGREGEKR